MCSHFGASVPCVQIGGYPRCVWCQVWGRQMENHMGGADADASGSMTRSFQLSLEICTDSKPVLSPQRLDIRDRQWGVWCWFLFNAALLPRFPKASDYCQTFMWDRVTRGSFHSSLPGDIRHPPAVSHSLCLPTAHPPTGKHCTSLFSNPLLTLTPWI